MSDKNDLTRIFSLLQTRFNVSRETLDRLTLYHDTLVKWQNRINLIGPQTTDEIWSRHILDSIQLLPLLPTSAFTMGDIGSGAGFPGMVIAIASPQAKVTFIESDSRKNIFLQEILRLTKTSASLSGCRVEALKEEFDILTARACADLTQLCAWSLPLTKKNTKCLFLKGKNYTKEVEEARRIFSFDSTPHPSLTDSSGIILEIQRLSQII